MAKHYKQFKLDPYTCWLRVYIDRDAINQNCHWYPPRQLQGAG